MQLPVSPQTSPPAPTTPLSARCSTGKERDFESGLDYFGARYYASNMGRFMSPDWAAKAEPVPYAKLNDPQSLNLYTYVNNNPLSRFDANGHDWVNRWLQQNAGFTQASVFAQQQAAQQAVVAAAAQTAQAQQQTTPAPAPTPNPNGSVPAPPPGKGPGWKPGDPLTPNEWVPGQGSTDRPTRWDPKYPIPGQSPPNTSWDAPNGHWDNPDGKGNTTRWLPGGVPVDHDNNPITRNVVRGAAAGAAAIGTGYIIYRVIRMLPSLAPPLWPTIPANAIIP